MTTTPISDDEVTRLIAMRDQLMTDIENVNQLNNDDPLVQAAKANLEEARQNFNALLAKAQQSGSPQDVAAAVEQALKVSTIVRELNDRLSTVETTLFGVQGDDNKVGLVKRFGMLDDDVTALESALGRSEDNGVVTFGFVEKTKTSINMLGEALGMSEDGKSSRLDQLETRVERLESGGNAGSFGNGLFMACLVIGLVIGAVVGFIFGAWIMSAMVGATLGAVVGYVVASKKSKQPESAPSQPAQS